MRRRAGLARRLVAVLAAGVALLTASSCTPQDDGVAASSAPTPRQEAGPALSAVAFRLREDEAAGGRFQVKVANAGDAAVRVRAVALDSTVLEPAPATPRDTLLRPGARVDLPVVHGPARCDDPARATAVTAVLTLEQDGAQRQVRLPLDATPSSREVLTRIHDESCAAQRVAAVVQASLAVGEPVADEVGLALPATIVLERTGSGAEQPTVAATTVGGSVLYGLTAAPGVLPATLSPAQARLEVPVLVRSTRCSGHVLGEVKKPYELGVWISLDGGPEQWTLVATPPDVRAALRSYLQQACGLG